jgi:hypothetical protein
MEGKLKVVVLGVPTGGKSDYLIEALRAVADVEEVALDGTIQGNKADIVVTDDFCSVKCIELQNAHEEQQVVITNPHPSTDWRGKGKRGKGKQT